MRIGFEGIIMIGTDWRERSCESITVGVGQIERNGFDGSRIVDRQFCGIPNESIWID